MPSSGTLRRRYRTLRSSACSANVAFAHGRSGQRNRRTAKMISTGRPPAAPSATTRAYAPWILADTTPHDGHRAHAARQHARIATASPVSSTRRMRSPRRPGEQHQQQFLARPGNLQDTAGGCGRPGRRHGRLRQQRGSRAREISADSRVLPEPRCHPTATRRPHAGSSHQTLACQQSPLPRTRPMALSARTVTHHKFAQEPKIRGRAELRERRHRIKSRRCPQQPVAIALTCLAGFRGRGAPGDQAAWDGVHAVGGLAVDS